MTILLALTTNNFAIVASYASKSRCKLPSEELNTYTLYKKDVKFVSVLTVVTRPDFRGYDVNMAFRQQQIMFCFQQ